MSNKSDNSSSNLICSFCGKSHDEVVRMIAGPSVFICDECVALCNEVIAEGANSKTDVKEENTTQSLPTPHEIRHNFRSICDWARAG
jgi:ATP-dependent Clp protease ATP-binding subunit ClpX